MLVRDVMSKKPVTLRQRDTLEKTVRVLAKHGITGCPVVDSRKRVVGIITQTDILRAIDAQGKILQPNEDLFSIVLGFLKGREKLFKKALKAKVREHMKREVITITEEEDIANAIAVINQHDIERLPVVKKGKLVGIISRKDVIKFLKS